MVHNLFINWYYFFGEKNIWLYRTINTIWCSHNHGISASKRYLFQKSDIMLIPVSIIDI